jgi:hypothetical protein
MSDLVRGRFPVTSPFAKLTGLASNATQGNIAVRSNMEWFGLANPTDGALAATGVGCAVPIPVENGDVISKITILAGATAEATGTHAFAALYSGLATPALLAQSADNTGAAAVAASAAFTFTLATPQTITATNAPNGFVYASIAVTATTVPTAAVVSIPTAVGYQWFTNGPLFLAATHGSALAGTAATTIASPAAKAVAPLVFLS